MALDPRDIRAAIANLMKTGEYGELNAASEDELDQIAEKVAQVELTDNDVNEIWQTLPHEVGDPAAAKAQAKTVVERLAHGAEGGDGRLEGGEA